MKRLCLVMLSMTTVAGPMLLGHGDNAPQITANNSLARAFEKGSTHNSESNSTTQQWKTSQAKALRAEWSLNLELKSKNTGGKGAPGQDQEAHHQDALIKLTEDQRKSLNLTSHVISKGSIKHLLTFPAELQFDPMNVAHLAPRVEGIVREVRVRLGDMVEKGQVLAILESRELGSAKSNYLAALTRLSLRQKTLVREERLWQKGFSAEQDYLVAEQATAESHIEVREAREALFALGLDEKALLQLPQQSESSLNRYQITAPFKGQVTEQHITLGEVVKEDRAPFVVVDTRTMWVMAQVPERDLSSVRSGIEGVVQFTGLPQTSFSGTVDFISHQLDRNTRTAAARLVLENPNQLLRAGMYGSLAVTFPNPKQSGGFLVPQSALQMLGDQRMVFRQIEPGNYQMISVSILAQSGGFAEVMGDLNDGDRLVTGDTFILKSIAAKERLGEGHAH